MNTAVVMVKELSTMKMEILILDGGSTVSNVDKELTTMQKLA